MTSPAPTTNAPLSAMASAAFRAELRAYAETQLPPATVPSRIVVLPVLPKLPNGKVDRGKLPAPPADDGRGMSYVAPRTAQEAELGAIWADVLSVDRVGLHDNFFELGGTSLTAAQMAARVRAATGTVINLRKLFEEPTLDRLASQLEGEPRPSEATPPATAANHTTGDQPAPSSSPSSQPNPRSVSPEQLVDEARLPDDVTPDPGAAPPSSTPYRSVFLTGGTGYTGSYLIRELLDRSRAHVTVLVRARDREHGMQRVRASMERFGLWRPVDGDRVTAVVGDLSRPYLGLDRSSYEQVSQEADIIVHSGALSSYALPYGVLKPVNVLGTLEVLRLAGRDRVKPIHYVSSLAVYPGRAGHQRWAEQEVTDPHGVIGGYRQTKWVGDSMMAQARRRGFRVNVYRPGLITGAQETGACATDTFINAVVKGCIQLGAYFDFDAPLEVTPVDFFAAAVAQTALEGSREGLIFNLPGARPMDRNELFERVLGHGYPLRRVSYRDWYRELSDAVERGEDNELARFLSLFGDEAPSDDIGYQGASPVFGTVNLTEALAGSGIVCAPPDQELFDRYLGWFVGVGYLPPPPAPARSVA